MNFRQLTPECVVSVLESKMNHDLGDVLEEPQHYVVLAEDGQLYGPFSVDLLTEYARENRIIPSTRLRNENGITVMAGEVLRWWIPPVDAPADVGIETVNQSPLCKFESTRLSNLNYASWADRFSALSVDVILFGVVDITFYAFWLLGRSGLSEQSVIYLILVANFLLTLLFNSWLSATPGKILFDLRIVAKDGSKPSFWQVLIRTSTGAISSFPTLWRVFFGHELQNGAETWSSTATISVR